MGEKVGQGAAEESGKKNRTPFGEAGWGKNGAGSALAGFLGYRSFFRGLFCGFLGRSLFSSFFCWGFLGSLLSGGFCSGGFFLIAILRRCLLYLCLGQESAELGLLLFAL